MKEPGLSSSKSASILKAVQGLTPKVAADSTGMSFGKVTRSPAFKTTAVLHVPVRISAGLCHILTSADENTSLVNAHEMFT